MKTNDEKALQAYRQANQQMHQTPCLATLGFESAKLLLELRLKKIYGEQDLISQIVGEVIDKSWSAASPARYIDEVSENYTKIACAGLPVNKLLVFDGSPIPDVVLHAYIYSVQPARVNTDELLKIGTPK